MKDATAVLRDSSLDDEKKEAYVQKSSLRLLKLCLVIFILSAICLIVPTGLLYVFEYLGLITVDAVVKTSLSLEFLVVVTIVMTGFYYLYQKK